MSVTFEINDQVRKDFQATIDFWKAASESDNINFNKLEWKRYEEIKHLLNKCAFCEYCIKTNTCSYCPLFSQNLCSAESNYKNTTYNMWCTAEFLLEKKMSAEKIYNFCLIWCNENIFNKK